eukprot:GFKZ01001263.1.p1 GENE.GFKZ01001263.1~~GFKZ01001263.1.p1  ORF type:complete len:1101 (+),score=144.18 GFKZ01001263.1:386-3304(+)
MTPPLPPAASASAAQPLLPTFERHLLLCNAPALLSLGLPDAAAVAKGDYTQLLSEPATPSSPLSAQIAQDTIHYARNLSQSPSLLHQSLISASAADSHHLCAIYTAGVGLLQAFLSLNWAGPCSPQHPSTSQGESSAALVLASGGEDVARPARNLVWLRAARRILVDCVQDLLACGASLAPWWAARVLLAHQAVLMGPAPRLRYDVFTMFARFLGPHAAASRNLYDVGPANDGDDAGADSDSEDEWGLPTPVGANGNIEEEGDDFVDVLDERDAVDGRLKVLANLELALAQNMYFDGDGALKSVQRACRIERITFRVTGEIGVRTKHQTKATAQLIARAFHIAGEQDPPFNLQDFAVLFPRRLGTPNASVLVGQGEEETPLPPLPINVPVNDTDVLGYVRLTGDQESMVTMSDDGDGTDTEEDFMSLGEETAHLTPMQQALALGRAAVVRAMNPSHVLTREQMAPYVDLVIRNEDSPWGTNSMVQIRALLSRVSFEQDRGRYLERCMSQMEEIGKFIDDPMDSFTNETRNAAACERNLFIFATSVPARWELKKELAIAFGKIGLVKSAMEIFEKLEYWDELIDCHRLIGNLGAAESLVNEQLRLLDKAVLEEGLAETSEDLASFLRLGGQGAVHARAARRPRLLCVLGDVTRKKEHYETAWEESGHKYARAKRSLGRMCIENEEWEAAVYHFKSALTINPLFPDVWFAHGCAAIQIDDYQLAAHSFTMVVKQTPDNGEAWNNLGRVLHELGKKKEALSALTEAGKKMRDSWRIWNNILTLSTEIRSSLDIVRSMERLLELRGKDGVVSESIGVAVSEVIGMSGSNDIEDKALVGPVSRRLLKVLGRCTALVSTNPSIWAAYAELHELNSEKESAQRAFDCRLKQVRSLIAHAQWKSDRREFRHMALASDSLAKNAIRSRNGLSIRSATLHLQSVIEQTKEDLREDEGFFRLQQVQDLLKSQDEDSGVDKLGR